MEGGGLRGGSGRPAADGGPGKGLADRGGPRMGGGELGELDVVGDINIDERPESVLDTLDSRRDDNDEDDSPPRTVGGGGGSWSKESRVMPRGLLLPLVAKCRTLPGCASAEVEAQLSRRYAPLGLLLSGVLLPPLATLPLGDGAPLRKESAAEARR